MVLKLSLPEDRFVWALSHPISREYIHQQSSVGYQKCNLIISQADTQPVEVKLEDYPRWAQVMIKTSIRAGQLVNTGDSIEIVKLEIQKDTTEVTVEKPVKAVELPKQTVKKKRQTRKKKVE